MTGETKSPRTKKKIDLKALSGVVISIVFLYFAFRKVEPDVLLNALREADYIYMIPVILLMLLSMVFRSIRWRYLLRSVKPVGLRSLFSAAAIGLMANNLLPARLGEFVRAYFIGEKEKISKSSSFATIVIERVLDGLTVLFFVGIMLFINSFSFPAILRKAAWTTVVLYLLIIGFLILAKTRREKTISIVSIFTGFLPERVSDWLSRSLNSFIDGLAVIESSWDILFSILFSFLVWIPNILVIWLLFLSFGFSLPAYAPIVLFVILTLGIMIPSAPGFVGTIQYCTVLGLGLFSIPESTALSYSIVYHAGVFIPLTGAGLICLFIEGLSFSDLKRLRSKS